jgi:hypothetical protein
VTDECLRLWKCTGFSLGKRGVRVQQAGPPRLPPGRHGNGMNTTCHCRRRQVTAGLVSPALAGFDGFGKLGQGYKQCMCPICAAAALSSAACRRGTVAVSQSSNACSTTRNCAVQHSQQRRTPAVESTLCGTAPACVWLPVISMSPLFFLRMVRRLFPMEALSI